uniref:Uncharacterized protein n=1 Tax=Glossina pallidipes TaxID=7398 RepID=A0A1B0ADZ9_GLOPL
MSYHDSTLSSDPILALAVSFACIRPAYLLLKVNLLVTSMIDGCDENLSDKFRLSSSSFYSCSLDNGHFLNDSINKTTSILATRYQTRFTDERKEKAVENTREI